MNEYKYLSDNMQKVFNAVVGKFDEATERAPEVEFDEQNDPDR